jgi:CheY-like chemotaxis protein
MTILVVEDNELNREILTRRLIRKGFEILQAADGIEAVRLARELHPALILMDMSLPGIDGWQATRILKSDAATVRMPVIALTAHAMAGDCEKAMEAGCDDYDTKPVDMPRLLGKIERLIALREPTAPADPAS